MLPPEQPCTPQTSPSVTREHGSLHEVLELPQTSLEQVKEVQVQVREPLSSQAPPVYEQDPQLVSVVVPQETPSVLGRVHGCEQLDEAMVQTSLWQEKVLQVQV
jgi:hypothetical protein